MGCISKRLPQKNRTDLCFFDLSNLYFCLSGTMNRVVLNDVGRATDKLRSEIL